MNDVLVVLLQHTISIIKKNVQNNLFTKKYKHDQIDFKLSQHIMCVTIIDDGDSTSEECRNAGVPFLCQYVYHLCDSENSETSFLPSKEECDYVSTEACATEWKAFSSQLPKCNDLPNQTHPKSEFMKMFFLRYHALDQY